MTDKERKQLEDMTAKLEYLFREGVHFTPEDYKSIVYAMRALNAIHNDHMIEPNHEWMEKNIPY